MAKINDSSDVAVLFVLVGWAIRYDGTEPIIGGNSYLQYNAENNTEMDAFVRDNKGYYLCGIDRGKVNEPSLDVVFVARNIQMRECAVHLHRDIKQHCSAAGAIDEATPARRGQGALRVCPN